MMCVMATMTVWVMLSAATTDGFPDEFGELQALYADEKAFTAKIKQLHEQETTLAKDELQQALGLEQSGRMAEAKEKKEQAKARYARLRASYEIVLKRYPQNAVIHNAYGEVLYDGFQEEEKGVEEWLQASKLDPTLSTPYNNLGIHYCHTGVYDKGLDCAEKAVQLDPKHPDYLFNLAQFYLIYPSEVQKRHEWDKKRVYKEAMKCSKEAAQLSPDDYSLLTDHAMNFFASENFGVKADWSGAAEAWRRARAKTQNPLEVFRCLMYEARAWIQKPNADKAKACLEEALKLQPGNDTATRLLSELKEKSGTAKKDTKAK